MEAICSDDEWRIFWKAICSWIGGESSTAIWSLWNNAESSRAELSMVKGLFGLDSKPLEGGIDLLSVSVCLLCLSRKGVHNDIKVSFVSREC